MEQNNCRITILKLSIGVIGLKHVIKISFNRVAILRDGVETKLVM